MGLQTNVAQRNAAYWNKITDETEDAVYRALKKSAQDGLHVLRYRGVLDKHGGRWPRWHKDRPNQAHSYTGWKLNEKKGKGNRPIFTWSNSVTNHVDDFNYPVLLAWGNGWGVRAKTGNRLVRDGAKIFSTQLPKGLYPFIENRDKKTRKLIKEYVHDI